MWCKQTCRDIVTAPRSVYRDKPDVVRQSWELCHTGKGRMKCLACTALCLLLLGADVFTQDVDTTHGRVRGLQISVLGKNLDVYYGIPFAKPPTGELRFKHPKPADHWRPQVKDARAMKPSCQQIYQGSFEMPLRALPSLMSEDCLYLNMWVPKNVTSGTKLATMVWIYGGSFARGSINLPLLDGKYLAAENNVIVASLNYRVGALGFLYLGPDTFPGNQGMMDQTLGLKWIYENIERFGGDRKMITIFGESSGGASVGHHLLSPLSRDFFTRAIIQSAAPNARWAYQTPVEARTNAKRLAVLSNCSSASDAGIYECIQNLPPGSILNAQSKVVTATVAFGPLIDGYFLHDNPNTLVTKGSVKKTEVLIGVNKDEGTIFLAAALPAMFPLVDQITLSRTQFLSATNIFSFAFGGSAALSKPMVAQYEGTQVAAIRDSYADLADDIFADYSFKCPVVQFSNMVSLWSNMYLYSFEHMISSLPVPTWMGTPHTYEIEMVFGHPLGDVLSATQDEKDLSRAMMAYWTNFAKTGNPNLPTGPSMEWPRYNTTEERLLVLDIPGQQRVQQGLRKQECVFWNDLVPLILVNTATTGQPATTTERVIYLPCVSSGNKVEVISWILLVSLASCLITQLVT